MAGPTVLFVCIQNAGRSQMAEAFAKRAGIDARSAGSAPAAAPHPEVVAAMREVGIDISDNKPKGLTDDITTGVDIVVTMGCGDACPYVPGAIVVDWELDDPSGRSIEDVRSVRDEIAQLVEQLKPSA